MSLKDPMVMKAREDEMDPEQRALNPDMGGVSSYPAPPTNPGAPLPAAPDPAAKPDPFKSIQDMLVTKQDLQDSADQKRKLALMGAMGDTLSNSQSFGNFFTGHMNQKLDGSSKLASALSDQADLPIQQKMEAQKEAQAAPGLEYMKNSTNKDSDVSKLSTQANQAQIDKFAASVQNPQLKATLSSMRDKLDGLSAYEQNQLLEKSGLTKLMGQEGMSSDKLAATMMMSQRKLEQGDTRIGEMQSQNSAGAGDKFEKDKIILASKQSNNSLDRAMSILNNPNKPVTAKDFNLAQTDFTNAVDVSGKATEGKINRELPETFAQQWNDLKGKAGEFDDLRQSPTGAKVIEILKQNIAAVKGDINTAAGEQAKSIYSNFKQHSNPQVRQIALDKLKQYNPAEYARETGASDSAPQQPVTPDEAQKYKDALTEIRAIQANPNASESDKKKASDGIAKLMKRTGVGNGGS